MIMDFQKGDIVTGTNRHFDAAYHSIVYLGDSLDHEFIGVILTKSRGWSNIRLPENYISTNDEAGNRYSFQYNNTHFARVVLDKPRVWGPYYKVGQITPEGITFIEGHIQGMAPMTYDEYRAKMGF